MTTNDTELVPGLLGVRGRPASLRLVALVVALVGSAAVLVGCSSTHKTATPPSSASAPASSALSSAPVSPLPSVPISAFPASPLASAASSLPTPPSSAVPGAPLVANIEAPATKSGFQIRLHKGSILKVDATQAKAGTPLTFALVPATSTFLTPIPGQDGFYMGVEDGVVNVTVMQGATAIGTLTVTVWG